MLPPCPVKTAAKNIRHRSCAYYSIAKIGGRKIRKSLSTDILRQAKLNRDAETAEIRARTKLSSSGYSRWPSLAQIFSSSPELPAARSADWPKDAAKAGWAEISRTRNASQCNICLHTLRRALRAAIEAGVRTDDPTASLKRKRLPKRKLEDLPNLTVLQDLLSKMRSGRGKPAAIAFIRKRPVAIPGNSLWKAWKMGSFRAAAKRE